MVGIKTESYYNNRKGVIYLENRTVIINGVSYTCLTDEEYENLQIVTAYEERKKSKDFKTISFGQLPTTKRSWACNCPVVLTVYTSDL